MRLIFAVLLLSNSLTVAAESLQVAALRPFLEQHCLSCHTAETKSGGFNLEQLFEQPGDLPKWVRVYDRTASGEMPPAKRPRPPHAEQQAWLQQLGQQITTQQSSQSRATIRRMNRTEYENTLRDLLDIPWLHVKDLLPEDGRAFGYDRSAGALDVSPILLSKYDEAADVALDAAIATTTLPPATNRLRLYAHHQYDFLVTIPNGDGVMLKDFKYDDSRFPIPRTKYAEGRFDLGELDRSAVWKQPASAGLFRRLGESFPGRFQQFSPIYAGKYRVSVSVWSFWWNQGKVEPSPRVQSAGIYHGSRVLGFFDAPSLKPTGHEWIGYLTPGEFIKFDAASLWEVHPYHHQGKAAEFIGPGIAIDHLDIEGPLYEEWPPRSHRLLLGDDPLVPFSKLDGQPKPKRTMPRQLMYQAHNSPGPVVFGTVVPQHPIATAEKLIKGFLLRAFRRPVTPTEVARYTGLAVQRLAVGDCFEDAMRAAYKAILCSPEFLFLHEPTGPLDSYAIASRLSYGLWNSLPDETLFRLAERDQLRDPRILHEQLDRMLADPKAERFLQDFLDQWLDLRDLDATTPDKLLYPEYDLHLRDAIQREPREFLAKLLRDNRHVSELVRSNFAMLNQRLAEHYQIPGVTGNRFQTCALPASAHRGGFLTQAAILKVTANGTTTSPVKRGAWLLRKLLGQPPQPPPPDIPAVEPDVRGTVTIRDQLAKHRDNPSCAVCHAKMDPPGFALENFDVIGGYRERYRAIQGPVAPDFAATFRSHLDPAGQFPNIYSVGFRLGLPVDASAQVDRGPAFKHIDEYRNYLATQDRLLARNFVNQLAIYLTGSPVRFADRSEVEQILNRSGLGLRALLRELISSPLFLHR